MDTQLIKRLQKEEIELLEKNQFWVTITDKTTGKSFDFHSRSMLGKKMDKQGMIKVLEDSLNE